MEKMEIRMYSAVVEFHFGSSQRIVFATKANPTLKLAVIKKAKKMSPLCVYISLVFIIAF